MEKPQARADAHSVSAIIVSYYTGPLLVRAIGSLVGEAAVGEIIVVDNGNWPGAVEAAAAAAVETAPDAAKKIRIISGHGNVGFAAACNIGARSAAGAFLLFLNPDAAMVQGGVARLLADGRALERPWMIGAKLVDGDGVEQQGSRRMTLTPWRAFVEATRLYDFAPRHPYFRRFNLHREPCPKALTPVPTVSGACFFLPSSDYFAIGGMDERYFLHVEDVDFCLRFRNAGGEVWFDPHVAVLHAKSSSRASFTRVSFRKTASMLRYFRTHFSDVYPAPFLWLVALALWSAFALGAVGRALAGAGRAVSGLARLGFRGVRRARVLARRRSSR